MSEFDELFGVEKPTPKPKVIKEPRPRKKKVDNSQLIMDFSRVVNCIHVNIHQTHRETLKEIVGSYKVAEVRKYLTDKLLEALKQ